MLESQYRNKNQKRDAVSFSFEINQTIMKEINEQKIQSNSSFENPCQIDNLSILSKNLQHKVKGETQALGLSESTRSHNHQSSRQIAALEGSEIQSLKINDGDCNEHDMSFLVVEGLEIARRESKREHQINSIVPKYRFNCLILSQQLRELLFQVEMALFTEEESFLKQRIKEISNSLVQIRKEGLVPSPKIFISPRLYASPKGNIIHKINHSRGDERKVRELAEQLRKKKQEFLKNKLKLQQLVWEQQKLQRKTKVQGKKKNRPGTLKTVSKKKTEQSEIKQGFRRIRPTQNTMKRLTVNKDRKSFIERDISKLKRDQLSCKKQNVRSPSDAQGELSFLTQESTKKQILARRLKIIRESIAMHEGTFSKMIAQLQLQCRLLSKQIECFEDQLVMNAYMLEKSEISKKNYAHINTTSISNIQKQIGKHSKSISPSPHSKSKLTKCNSQNLRKLVQSKEQKLSSYLLSKSRQRLTTCKKVQGKPHYEVDLRSRKSSKANEYSSPDTIRESSEKNKALVMQQYFEKENKLNRKKQPSLIQRYSPKLSSRFY